MQDLVAVQPVLMVTATLQVKALDLDKDQALVLEAVVQEETWQQDLVVAEVAVALVSQAMVEVHLLLAKDLDQVQALEGLASV